MFRFRCPTALQILVYVFLISNYLTVTLCGPSLTWSFWSVCHFICFHLLMLMILVTYTQSCFIAPGSPPPHWQPPPELLPEHTVPRYCNKCQSFKPPRAHHCSQCGRCVLRMDHHCPWVGTCVGAGNHKSFLLFLFYTLVGSVYSFIFNLVWGILCLYRTSLLAQAVPPGASRAAVTLPFEHPTVLGGIAIGLGCAYTFIFAMATGSLLVWQLEVAATNVTTIESYMQDRYLDPDQKRQGRWKHVYDLGRMANLRSFLGPRVAQWLLPVNHPVDGLTGWRYAPLLDAAAEVTDDEYEELEEAPPDPEPLPGEGHGGGGGERAAPRAHHGPRAPVAPRPPTCCP
ncbi:putative palmitoyltransferase PFA4 [Paratrimastix pyriformis]|uniref:Palmitoyltransferase n=1 Tax=Paratrimastix pyriformis TaxID=342808 RepID=A0ABQ8UTD1_9EUKA|nr:putative palmitoyltransferase PFA4 [Paratrimastix pyriformis]